MISGLNPLQNSTHTTDRHTYHYGGITFNKHLHVSIHGVYLPLVVKNYSGAASSTNTESLNTEILNPYPPPLDP